MLKPAFLNLGGNFCRIAATEAADTVALAGTSELNNIFQAEIAQTVRTDDVCDFINRVVDSNQIFTGVNICTIEAGIDKRRR